MAENQLTQHVFHFDEDRDNFEGHAVNNGIICWYAADLMQMLGYQSLGSFRGAINKAMGACIALGINVAENFVQTDRSSSGGPANDIKLSRFACYLTAMNADAKKPQVAAAQAYFAALAESFQQSFQEADAVERVLIREEVSEREKILSGVAKQAGVLVYAFFQNEGYRGMYNMPLAQLRARRGIPAGKTPLDHMGKAELAGNLFRITQTEEKIKNEGIRGQPSLERAAFQVGQKVRHTMIELSGKPPESLPVEEHIKDVKKGLKTTQKGFAKLDEKKKPRQLKPKGP
jgi:DNA-damage-inducible protein D